METLPIHLKIDYLRSTKLVENCCLPFDKRYVCVDDVLKAHYFICDYFEESTGKRALFGVKDHNLLCSAVCRQATCFQGIYKWKDGFHITATLFFGLVKNHAFHDSNKRTALLTLLYQLTKQHRIAERKQSDFETLTVRVASDSLDKYPVYNKFKKKDDTEVRTIAYLLKSMTRKTDKTYRSITYREFNTKLKTYGAELKDAGSGKINVYCTTEEIQEIAILRRKKKFKKVRQIGFPGWTKQIHPKALKEVLKACGLSDFANKGIDTKVFFEGADPLYQLINEYKGPLKRLSDK